MHIPIVSESDNRNILNKMSDFDCQTKMCFWHTKKIQCYAHILCACLTICFVFLFCERDKTALKTNVVFVQLPCGGLTLKNETVYAIYSTDRDQVCLWLVIVYILHQEVICKSKLFYLSSVLFLKDQFGSIHNQFSNIFKLIKNKGPKQDF